MRAFIVKQVSGSVLGSVLLFGAVSVSAHEAGDLIIRAGVAGVLPTDESETISALGAGAKVEADDALALGITGTYMVCDNIGIGLLLASPFRHDIDAKGSIPGLGTVAETRQLPPTLTLQYHFDTGSTFNPYIGVGLNYTVFFSEDTKGALNGLDLDLDDSWGLALEAGMDDELKDDWLISAQVWYLNIDTQADVQGVGKFDVDIDPWVVMIGVGKRF